MATNSNKIDAIKNFTFQSRVYMHDFVRQD